ncbi:MAG: formylglycine-generating enzyme family protein [Nitrospirae bacterium]|nr:MAG: formylglycine-generating enzyme family protein [Nitrospirota bacterium]
MSGENIKTDEEMNPAGPEMIFVQGGTYQMGDSFGDGGSNERPVHQVKVDDFYIGKYQVTFDEYYIYCVEMGKNKPKDEGWGTGKRPAINVSWNDAADYCKWLTKKTGESYRLPTEAEWEYAARSGGKAEKWAGTSNESELGNYSFYDKKHGDQTHPVGGKMPNGLGIYDMSGNVWEWCSDIYDEHYYKDSAAENPNGPDSGWYRALRGGSWNNYAWNVRTTTRQGKYPVYHSNNLGFRVARTK